MNNYLKQALLFGLTGGVICFLWFLIVYYSGANPFYSFPQKLVILLQAVVSYLSIRDFRNRYYKEEFSFASGIFCGLAVSILLALVCSILVYIFVAYMHPEMVAAHIIELKNYLIANKQLLIKESSIEVFEGNFKNVNEVTTFTLVLDEFIWKMIRGIMFTILATLTLRREKSKIDISFTK